MGRLSLLLSLALLLVAPAAGAQEAAPASAPAVDAAAPAAGTEATAPPGKAKKAPEEELGLVIEGHGGAKSFDSPDVTGPAFGLGVRMVNHDSFRYEVGFHLDRQSFTTEIEQGFEVSQSEIGGGLDLWGGFGVGPAALLVGVGLGLQSVSGELTALELAFPYDPGVTLDVSAGVGVAADVGPVRPAFRLVYHKDLGEDAEAVDGGSTSGLLFALELGYEVTRW